MARLFGNRAEPMDVTLGPQHLRPQHLRPQYLRPQGRFKAPGPEHQNLPPSAGTQFFGHGKIEGATGQLTVTLRDRADTALWPVTLDPKFG